MRKSKPLTSMVSNRVDVVSTELQLLLLFPVLATKARPDESVPLTPPPRPSHTTETLPPSPAPPPSPSAPWPHPASPTPRQSTPPPAPSPRRRSPASSPPPCRAECRSSQRDSADRPESCSCSP